MGVARSGSSLLYRVLSRHPAFAVDQGAVKETKLLEHAHRSYGLLFRPDPRLVQYMGGDRGAFEAFQRSIRPVATFQRLLGQGGGTYDRLCRTDVRVWKRTGAQHVVVRFFEAAYRARGAARLVEKTPSHIHWARHLLDTFPDARLVVSVREPLGVLASYRRRLLQELRTGNGYKRWLDISLADFVGQYRTNLQIGHQLRAGRPQSVQIVRYEDVTAEPERTLRGLCAFVGAPYDPQMTSADGLAPWSHGADTAGVDPLLAQPITDRSTDWRDHVAEEEGDHVLRELAGVLEAAGYGPSPS
jgi:hypothetical protein